MPRTKQEALIVGDSHVGKMVIAGRGYRTGQKIARVTGEVLPDDGYGSDYCMDLGDGTVLEPHPPYRFFNHSCEPNCELIIWDEEDGRPPSICVHALRTIRAGEELTLDYAWPADAAIACLCGATSCRGWIVRADELELVRRRQGRGKSRSRTASDPTASTP